MKSHSVLAQTQTGKGLQLYISNMEFQSREPFLPVTSSVYKKVVIFHATKTTCKLCDDTFQIKGAVVTPIKYAMNHNLKLNKRNYQQNHLSFVTYTAFLYISNKNPDWAHTIDKSTTNGMPFCSCKNFRPHNQLHFSHPCRFSGILLSILNPILIILHSKF